MFFYQIISLVYCSTALFGVVTVSHEHWTMQWHKPVAKLHSNLNKLDQRCSVLAIKHSNEREYTISWRVHQTKTIARWRRQPFFDYPYYLWKHGNFSMCSISPQFTLTKLHNSVFFFVCLHRITKSWELLGIESSIPFSNWISHFAFTWFATNLIYNSCFDSW